MKAMYITNHGIEFFIRSYYDETGSEFTGKLLYGFHGSNMGHFIWADAGFDGTSTSLRHYRYAVTPGQAKTMFTENKGSTGIRNWKRRMP